MMRFRKAIVATALALAAIAIPATSAVAAPTAPHTVAVTTTTHYVSRITVAYEWAVTHTAGHRYCFGGNGTSNNSFGCPAGTYDCSGLVMVAYSHAGIILPHNTVAMLYSGKLHRVTTPEPGDLAFYGSGHVELVATGYHRTFGAHSSSDPVIGFRTWSAYWHPTMFMRV